MKSKKIKKFISAITSAAMCVSALSIPVNADVAGYVPATLYGDANCDKIVSVADVVVVAACAANPDNFSISSQGLSNADVAQRGDGLSALDASLIQAISLNLPIDVELPDIPKPTEPTESTTTTTTTTTTETTTTTITETTTIIEPPIETTTVVYEEPTKYYAIDAQYSEAIFEDINSGFDSTGYVNCDNKVGSYINWTVSVPAAGNYEVTFRYANGSANNRITNITVNGSSDYAPVDFNTSGAWTTWTEQTVVLSLKSGSNTIKATSATADGAPNMDYIILEKTDKSPAVLYTPPKEGAKQVENLNRGVVAVNSGKGVLVSWRLLATDNENTTFKLYKNGQAPPIYEGTINDATCFFDSSGTAADWYTIDTFVGDTMTEFAQVGIGLTNANSGQSGGYMDIPIQKPADMTMPDGTVCSYSPNDASVGDIDGDGQYEIFLKWDPSNSKDNSKDGYTGNVYIDCYKLDGTLLWRIDLGKNIRAGAHYTQFMVYDFDGDGKAEMICKTSDGTVDGTGKVIGDASADYRAINGYILTGAEYLTLFDGATGKALDTINYTPARGTVSDWGDSYGNRVDRFVATVAYLDGATPSAVFSRGYYTRTCTVAYDVVNKKLVSRWTFDTGNNESALGYGDGNHGLMAADVDADGKDEVIVGSLVIDDNGKALYSSGLGHGDALHVGDFIPDNPGLEIFMCHEEKEAKYGISLRDGKTGNIIFKKDATGDTGRCIADNLIAGNSGAEFTGSHDSIIYNEKGEEIAKWSDITKWGMNSVVYWTDTLERAVLDRTMVDQYGKGRVFTGDGVTTNNSTKSNASLTCDLFGDWREEMIFSTSDGTALRVFSTTYTTEYPIYTLMQNVQYRTQVASQNTAYNQPPHTDYFIGTGFDLPEFPNVYAVK